MAIVFAEAGVGSTKIDHQDGEGSWCQKGEKEEKMILKLKLIAHRTHFNNKLIIFKPGHFSRSVNEEKFHYGS